MISINIFMDEEAIGITSVLITIITIMIIITITIILVIVVVMKHHLQSVMYP